MSKILRTGRERRHGIPAARPNHPSPLQVAALCYRVSPKGVRILLITSRETGRWIIPKGWPMRNRTEAEAAAREAFEEAGLRGVIGEQSIGMYTYLKKIAPGRIMPCVVRVFPLEVREMLRKYPETGQRRVKWFAQEKAARKVREPELASLISGFDPALTATIPRPPAVSDEIEA